MNGMLYALVGVGVFGLGLYGVVARAHLLRKLLAFNLMGSGVFLALVGLSQRGRQGEMDPVSQALVLTGIVVAVSATGFALALLRRLYSVSGATQLERERSGR